MPKLFDAGHPTAHWFRHGQQDETQSGDILEVELASGEIRNGLIVAVL
jgi:hypothetical protein